MKATHGGAAYDLEIVDYHDGWGAAAEPHPGEILALEFMQPLGLSQNALARALHVPPRRINELVQGKRAVAPIATCVSRAMSGFRRASSSACRPTTT